MEVSQCVFHGRLSPFLETGCSVRTCEAKMIDGTAVDLASATRQTLARVSCGGQFHTKKVSPGANMQTGLVGPTQGDGVG